MVRRATRQEPDAVALNPRVVARHAKKITALVV